MGVQVIPIPTEVVSHSVPFPFPILCFIPIPVRFPFPWESHSHAHLYCEHDILKTNKPILMQIGISGPQGKGMKRATLRVRRLKVKVTRHRNKSSYKAYSIQMAEIDASTRPRNLTLVCRICLPALIQYVNMTDNTHTDGQTPHDGTRRRVYAQHRAAIKRCKNSLISIEIWYIDLMTKAICRVL